MTKDFIFHGSLDERDPELNRLLALEDQRQDQTIILIASESMAPDAVRQAMESKFANVYAEGYPREESRRQKQGDILDTDMELALYRRNSDPRYYKGVEYADMLEALTRRRAAELFAANGITPDQLYVNVQPLSGAPANSAVYTALLQPGDTIMGLNLNDGGHLSHGTRINRSGQHYNGVTYFVDEKAERLDYDAVEKVALETKPQIIVAGFSAYPFIIDWKRFREIADKVGAYLLADISHISGLVASGQHPSPIGIADVVMTTTHKSLCGPRGAMILTHRRDFYRKIDRAVFPGEQGGPHLNTMAALAVALKLAKTDQFNELQARIVHNAQRLAQKLQEHGLRIVGGGTENHLFMLDTKSVSHNGVPLSGDLASRILDTVGIVVNRNTIPGDVGAFNPTGLRLGTVWISQLGFGDAEVDLLAEAIATVLQGCTPFTYTALGGKELRRAKVSYAALLRGRGIVRQLRGFEKPAPAGDTVELHGNKAGELLNQALTSDVSALAVGESQPSHLFGEGLDVDATVKCVAADHYQLRFADADTAGQAAEWLAALSDGYVLFDDKYGKLAGPVVVKTMTADGVAAPQATDAAFADGKPYFVGNAQRTNGEALPAFVWNEPEDPPLLKTTLHATHVEMGGKMVPFGGYDMPVWYSSVLEEHTAVRETAGLFDATHMGVFEASGPHVVEFLNTVTTNDVTTLEIGQSHYTYFLLPDGSVVDDLMIYRRGEEKFMLVVNASNNDKDWAWINAVNDGKVMIDGQRPFAKIQHPVSLKDLRDRQWGDECRVDIPLQGPAARDIVMAMCDDEALAKRVKGLPWAGLTEGKLAGFDVVISRTGYTGERIAYELFVHPDKAPDFWKAVVKTGEPFGLKPCGLASRDSTRTEAGLPLYGHELAGAHNMNPADAGFGSYVKLWKPFFIGRDAFIAREEKRDRILVRFRMNDKAVRRPETGDPVLDKRGKVVGQVTSCAVDSEGYMLGLALVPVNMSEVGTAVSIYQLGGGTRSIAAPKSTGLGARLPMPDGATILTRFPSKKR
ncbi:MAG: glycine cleavage system aminomethyltransferase GcvT [Ardenticatenaceae bacterium]|nr:glycine cleavage system aminomethyltransferase GcvT [Ardenticatenaceae bacterium]MCB9444475.1 glycine cleavage system aminomethyltransferase GcvT [Ardenticatenaceae bacterium]